MSLPSPTTAPASHPPPDPEIQAEAAYLAVARAALAHMYQDVVTTETPMFSSEDGDETYQNTVYQGVRARRALALVDLPDVPLFFGRLDYEPGIVYLPEPSEPDLPGGRPGSAAGSREARDLAEQPDLPEPSEPDLPGRPGYPGRPGRPGPPGSPRETADPAGPDRVYIGRRHVHDAAGRPMVVDWRAPISTPFYRASRDDPLGVRLRRRYGFDGSAALTAYEDDPLVDDGISAMVTAEIERPRAGPMRDIVATIQPEQDHLVRAPLHPTLCIQGAPGTGKTAVGLHRLAYLLYTERARLARGGVAVVGPNRSFLAYIRRVLPALGEVNVSQTTIAELIGGTSVRAGEASVATRVKGEARAGEASVAARVKGGVPAGEDPYAPAKGGVPAGEDPDAARVKGEARMAPVLHRALWLHVQEPADELVFTQGSHRYRVSRPEISEVVAGLRGHTRYGPGRTSLTQRLAHLVLLQMEGRGASPDDREQARVARSAPVRRLVDQVWPKLVPEQVLYALYADPDFLARAAQQQLTAAEQALLRWPKPFRSWRSARWSEADAALLDELAGLIERTPSLGHIVVDEAQDLSPMQCRALGRRCTTGSFTVLGDIAQGTSPWAIEDWSSLWEHLGKPDAQLTVLDQGFRVPAQIIGFAARLLPEIAPGLRPPASVRQAPGALQIIGTTPAGLRDTLTRTCREALAGAGMVGVIAADAEVAAIYQHLLAGGLTAGLLGVTEDALETARLVCVPATLTNGLEFDAVVVAEPARIVSAEPRGLHRLYVVLTRAVTSLHVVHADPLPAPLQDA